MTNLSSTSRFVAAEQPPECRLCKQNAFLFSPIATMASRKISLPFVYDNFDLHKIYQSEDLIYLIGLNRN